MAPAAIPSTGLSFSCIYFMRSDGSITVIIYKPHPLCDLTCFNNFAFLVSVWKDDTIGNNIRYETVPVDAINVRQGSTWWNRLWPAKKIVLVFFICERLDVPFVETATGLMVDTAKL